MDWYAVLLCTPLTLLILIFLRRLWSEGAFRSEKRTAKKYLQDLCEQQKGEIHNLRLDIQVLKEQNRELSKRGIIGITNSLADAPCRLPSKTWVLLDQGPQQRPHRYGRSTIGE